MHVLIFNIYKYNIKSARSDTEAMVVGVSRNSVKLSLYAIDVFIFNCFIIYVFCKMIDSIFRPNGISFLVPADNVRISTPKIGQVVTFSYERRTVTDTPLNPSIVKV
jgi:hypothetical protein